VDLPMPRLVLQPGGERRAARHFPPEGGAITIALATEGKFLRITVRNPAPPPEEEARTPHRGSGHAQRSIAHRLAYRFGPAARMTAGWQAGYYLCEIRLPL
jgi:two-component system sensor histidine kinase AlgZ